MRFSHIIRGITVTALIVGMIATTIGTARATPTASSSAYAESVNLTVLPLVGGLGTITSGPTPSVAGSAPPAYSLNDSLLSITVGTLLSANFLHVMAASDLPALLNASASATLSDVALSLAPLLTLGATTIQSTAVIDPSLIATGTTTIVGASLAGSLSPGLSIAVNPAPNTVLLDTGGIKIILNEQTMGGDGVTSRDISVNAVHINFNNAVLGLGLVNGDIILSHSEAHVAGVVRAVPEPASGLLLISGLAALAWWRRRSCV